MSMFRKALFYLGWFGNLATCVLALWLMLLFIWTGVKILWDDQSLKIGDCIAVLIVVVYSGIAARNTFKWLKHPLRNTAFDFVIYWVLSPFVWLLMFIAFMAGFNGSGWPGSGG